MDSGFCVTAGIFHLHELGVYGQALVKKHKYWPKDVPGDQIDWYFDGKELGFSKTLKQDMDGILFYVHCSKDTKFVTKMMSTHGLLTPVLDHKTYHQNASGQWVSFNYPEFLSRHNHSKHWVDDINNRCHDPIGLEQVWHTKWWPTRQFTFICSVAEANAVNCQGQGTSPLQPTAYAETPLKTMPFDPGAIGLHNTSDLPSLATRAEVNMDSEAVPTSLLEFNKNVHGTVCEYFHLAKLNSKGLATVTLPGEGGIMLFYGSNQIIKNNSQHHALIVLVSHSLPVDNALPFRHQARVVSRDTIIVPLPCGINPEIGKKIKEQLIHHTERIGENHSNLTNSLQAMQAHVQSMGYSVKFMGITIRNLPYALSQDGTFQDTSTLSIDPTGLTPVVTSNSFYCPDTLDGESGPINFNVTG